METQITAAVRWTRFPAGSRFATGWDGTGEVTS